MKTFWKPFLLLFLGTGTFLFNGCDDDDDPDLPVVTQNLVELAIANDYIILAAGITAENAGAVENLEQVLLSHVVAGVVTSDMLASLFLANFTLAQNFSAHTLPPDSLQQQLQEVNLLLDHMQQNLGRASQKMKYGILVATLGYSVTIAGGQLLGGPNNNLGEALLYTGGGIGIAGTVPLFDPFKFLKKALRPPPGWPTSAPVVCQSGLRAPSQKPPLMMFVAFSAA